MRPLFPPVEKDGLLFRDKDDEPSSASVSPPGSTAGPARVAEAPGLAMAKTGWAGGQGCPPSSFRVPERGSAARVPPS